MLEGDWLALEAAIEDGRIVPQEYELLSTVIVKVEGSWGDGVQGVAFKGRCITPINSNAGRRRYLGVN